MSQVSLCYDLEQNLCQLHVQLRLQFEFMTFSKF